jgi:hypothetical protein
LRVLGIGLFLGLLASATAFADIPGYRVLKLDGYNVRWQKTVEGRGLVVTYGIVTEPREFPGARNCRRMTSPDALLADSEIAVSSFRNEVAAAFAMWASIANISFREAAVPAEADILIGAQMNPEGWAFADVFFDAASPERVKPISRALICLNPERRWKVGFDGDLKRYDIRYTIAHEIGHAIGLDHPNGGGQIMAYRYEERFRTLQPGDVAGAALLYGARTPTEVQITADPSPIPGSHASAVRRLTKGWGTRAFKARSP